MVRGGGCDVLFSGGRGTRGVASGLKNVPNNSAASSTAGHSLVRCKVLPISIGKELFRFHHLLLHRNHQIIPSSTLHILLYLSQSFYHAQVLCRSFYDVVFALFKSCKTSESKLFSSFELT
jgi:hypothetical protein